MSLHAGQSALPGRPALKAFTLIEVLAVLLLLAIIATVLLFSIPPSSGPVVVEADRVATHLRHVQLRALSDVDPWQIEFSGTSYRAGRIGGGWERLPGEPGTVVTLPPGLTVSGPATIRFDPWGRPVDASGAALPADLVVKVGDSTYTATRTIARRTGLVR